MKLPPARRAGFTLIELMIVVAIVAVLVAIAWPSFTNAVNKSRRSDAMSALAQIMQAQERWRANNPSYQDTLANLPGASNGVSMAGHYDLSLLNGVTGSTYTAQASVHNGSPQSADSLCQTMQVTMNGGNITYTSVDSGGTVTTPGPCWVQ